MTPQSMAVAGHNGHSGTIVPNLAIAHDEADMRAAAANAMLSPAHLAREASKHEVCAFCESGERDGRPVETCPWCRGSGRGGWLLYDWVKLLNRKLVELSSRRIKRLIVAAPVRHGKSQLGSIYFPTWYLGTHPNHRVIVTGHNSDFAAGFGGKARDLMAEHGRDWFGVHLNRSSNATDRWDFRRPHRGGLIAVGVGNPPTGRGGNLIVIDDPVRNSEEAYSATYREKVWRWWQNDIRTRLEPGGVIVLIMSRWHDDDLTGRLLKRQEEGSYDGDDSTIDEWEVLWLPGLAEPAPEENVVDLTAWRDQLGRRHGAALCPERYSEQDLKNLRDAPDGMGPIAFQALIQNRPAPPEGNIFKRDDWRYIEQHELPEGLKLERRWDLAGSEDGDWTAGVLGGRSPEGITYIVDVVRGRWEPKPTEEKLRATAVLDFDTWGTKKIRIAQDPGQAGKYQMSHFSREVFHEFDFRYEPESGSKLVRAMPFAGQQAAHNVVLVRGPWNAAWVEEYAAFDKGKNDDQVDAGSHLYADCAGLARKRSRVVL